MLENLKLLVKSALVVDEEGTFCVPVDRIEINEDGIVIVVGGSDPEPDGGLQKDDEDGNLAFLRRQA